MRRTITISVSEEMHTLIQSGMKSRYYSTVSEYIRFLVRRDQAPDAVLLAEEHVEMPRTANQVIEDILRKREAGNGSRGRW